jgi:Ni,Fe-hydrogenase III small subunit
VLLVTRPVTKNMREALERTWVAALNPKFVVAVGDCGADGGMSAGSYATGAGCRPSSPSTW